MGQVSGSIALDLTKVVRAVVYEVVQELTRTIPYEDQRPTALQQITDAVAREVVTRLDRDLGSVLAEVLTKLVELEELVRAEGARRDRLTVGIAPEAMSRITAGTTEGLSLGAGGAAYGGEVGGAGGAGGRITIGNPEPLPGTGAGGGQVTEEWHDEHEPRTVGDGDPRHYFGETPE